MTEEDDDADAAARGIQSRRDLTINKVSRAQVGRVTEARRYMHRFGWLIITAADLANCKQFPTATFTLVRTAATIDAEDFDEAEGVSSRHFRIEGKRLAQ